MKTAFMSSVCPKQTLPELVESARRHGYEGIEFRVEWGHLHGIELDSSDVEIRQARKTLADAGIAATCIATGVKFNSADPAEHKPHREALRKHIALAAEAGAPCIRTFSDPVPEDDEGARDAVLSLAAESYASVDEWARKHRVEVLVETHTNMRGHWAKRIVDEANVASLKVLWDPGHHVRRGQSVDDAYGYLKGLVSHLHFGTQAAGAGSMSEAEHQRVIDLLHADGFQGFFSVEVINPDDPEAVLTYNAQQFREYFSKAGV
jgi:sugar phosphate isomerase/epimerase